MREFLKVHTINYFSSPKSEFLKLLLHWQDGQQLQLSQFQEASDVVTYISAGQRGAPATLLYWRKAFGMQRATVIYETSDLTPASFRTSLFSKTA